jgi:hypothetical protein
MLDDPRRKAVAAVGPSHARGNVARDGRWRIALA